MSIERSDEVVFKSPEQRIRLQALGMLLAAYGKSINAFGDAVREELTPELERVNREIRLSLGLALSGCISMIVSFPSTSGVAVSGAVLGAGAGFLFSTFSERREIRAQLAVVNSISI